MKTSHLTVYSISHFFVDFSCAFLLFGTVSHASDFALCVLLYNFCAFALQMPLGLFADRWNHNSILASVGCFLVVIAYILPLPLLIAVTAGTGNALFHLGGGIDTLNHSQKKAFALGIFVSPGAVGLYLGTLFGKTASLSELMVILPLLTLGILILFVCRIHGRGFCSENAPFSFESPICLKWLIPLFLVVVLRSYMGMNQQFDWKNQWHWGFVLVLALALGKMAGGLFMDRFGLQKTAVYTLAIAAVLYLFSGHPLPGITAVFLFNMTMPVTLWAVAKITPGMKGFTFGLLTFGLFLGYLPSAFGFPSLLNSRLSYSLMSLISLVLLAMVYRSLRKGNILC